MSIQKISRFVKTSVLTACLAFTANADDLEIYLGTGGSAVTYDPNVLFIMDTSGSMAGRDGTAESRMLRVQNALKRTLSTVTNINAGLMRFSDFGGPVLYPIRPIDDAVSPEMVLPIVQSSDDAYEISGTVNLSNSALQVSSGTENVQVGLRYQQVNIPQGATVTSAYLRFTSRALNTAVTGIKVSAEAVDDASTFTNSTNDISSRTRTTSEVLWSADNDFPLDKETLASPSLTAVVQEVINRAGWCGGNALNLLLDVTSVSSASDRVAYSADEGSGLSPQLVVEYDDSTAAGCVSGSHTYQIRAQKDNAEEKTNGYQSTGSELTLNAYYNRYMGLRFENIAVPQGATISKAHLVFTAYQNRYGSASFDISAANQANPGDFNRYSRYLLRDKPKTTAVTWSGISTWYRNNSYQSPDISAVVQQIVDRGDWAAGNAMMMILSNFSGVRGAYTYNGQPSGAVRLVVEYKGNATPGSSATVREHLISKVDELSASGYTPIVDTLYEATQYFAGKDVYYGLKRGETSVSSQVRRNTRVSHRLSYTGADAVLPAGCTAENLSSSYCVDQYIPGGAQYISPVTDKQCQTNNHIVLLSDGIANNNHSVDEIEALLGQTCTGNGDEKCGLDLVTNVSKSETSAIDLRLVTHTIGFAADATAANFLNKLALHSGGGFYQASDSNALVDVFQSILRSVKDINATFVSPGVAVNQLNRLTHKDELYFALFKPAEGTVWPGNLKKYKIDGDVILDKNGLDAVDNGTGFFSESSHSYWSTLADGNDVRLGGAAGQMDLVRNVFTFDGAGSIALSDNRLHESNSLITAADLGVDSTPDPAAVRETLLKWGRGVDVKDDDADGDDTDVRLQMGDPIHSQPVIVNYGASDSAILVATNQGYLHSFDPATGNENFAVIPRELLPNLYDFYRDNSTFTHTYGLDGDMVLRNYAGKAYLYLGMRRGGRNYYVFDITNKTSPSLLFTIKGGNTGFEKLGQSWSRPTISKINFGGSVKNVMIFGGGYDTDQDSKSVRSPDGVGNAVYIVDADDGSLLWSASNADASLNLSDMQYSIPARISVVDRDADGLADHMYVADTGGQLFRIDIYNGEPVSSMFKGKLLASFGGTVAEDNRRFYYGPDVSEISLGDEHYYAVALGSGYRAHPLNEDIQDHFYMYKDKGVFALDVNGEYSFPNTTLGLNDLYDVTNHLLTQSDAAAAALEASSFATKHGWMMRLDTGGEKVLASPLILNYRLFFTTYVPASASTSQCAPPTGNSRAYLVDLINGNAVKDFNNSSQLDHQDRYAQLKQTGIAPETKILIEDIIKPVVCLGTECTSAVIDVEPDGTPKVCTSAFGCLAENIYGRFERVQKSTWKSESERE